MYLIKYDQIILNDGFNEYEIIIPTYDIEKFNSLLNLKIALQLYVQHTEAHQFLT